MGRAAASTRSSRSGRFCSAGPARSRRGRGGRAGWAASAAAFLGLAEGPSRARLRTALALACWPGSFGSPSPTPTPRAGACRAWACAGPARPAAQEVRRRDRAVARPDGLIALPFAWLARGQGPRAWVGAAVPVAAAAAVEGYFWERSDDATVFFDAQKQWGRKGPGGLGHWASHLGGVLERHGVVIGLLAVAAAAAIVVAWRRFGLWPTASSPTPARAAAPGRDAEPAGLRRQPRAALVLPLLVVLWRLGPATGPGRRSRLRSWRCSCSRERCRASAGRACSRSRSSGRSRTGRCCATAPGGARARRQPRARAPAHALRPLERSRYAAAAMRSAQSWQ
jgi:hypothetical protein